MEHAAPSRTLKPWLSFTGAVLIVAVLFWAQAILVPTALAALLAFILNPPVNWLERRIGRTAAVLAAVVLVCSVFAGVSWGLVRQFDHFTEDLAGYRANILAKIADVRGAGKGGSIKKLEETVQDIKTTLAESDTSKSAAPPPIVPSARAEPMPGVFDWGWIGPFVGPLGTAGFALTMFIFMLLERRDLRDRLIGLIGHGHLALTTRALDDAGTRVSRQLLRQSLVNFFYGVVVGTGLFLLGVPYPLAWAALAAVLRFIPFVGFVMAAGGPIIVSLAALPGWGGVLSVAALFAALELFTSLVVETRIYAGAAGVSQVVLLLSVAFWTWLWGPMGLLMATPLTVCLVVLGKHVPGLAFVGTLMADSPALAPEDGYYQRLLARDMAEAADVIDRHIKTGPPRSVYDALLLPALSYAERDRLEGRLSPEEAASLVEATRELVSDAADSIRRKESQPGAADGSRASAQRDPLRVLGYASNEVSDVALAMLTRLLDDLPIAMEVASPRMLASELVAVVTAQRISVVCFSDLVPNSLSKTRYLVKRLHAQLPDVTIVVGRWAPPTLLDDSAQGLRDAGATFVASTLAGTRTYLGELVR